MWAGLSCSLVDAQCGMLGVAFRVWWLILWLLVAVAVSAWLVHRSRRFIRPDFNGALQTSPERGARAKIRESDLLNNGRALDSERLTMTTR